ncbi:hypothetical protein COOONC_19394 [Cooperia oncophora]
MEWEHENVATTPSPRHHPTTKKPIITESTMIGPVTTPEATTAETVTMESSTTWPTDTTPKPSTVEEVTTYVTEQVPISSPAPYETTTA